MTQEEKQLLLKDLCARLPYGVYVSVHDTFKYSTMPFKNVYLKSSDISSLIDSISLNEMYNSKDKLFNRIIKERKDFLEFKLYLRPMSSMTEEEKEELRQEHIKDEKLFAECLKKAANGDSSMRGKVITHFAADWCNKNYFDYRGLIEKGLALEAIEGMYNTKIKV